MDDIYVNIISSLPNDEVFGKNGNKLKGIYRKNNPVPGKLNDDRFGDMGRRADDDIRPLPGKLKNPFDGQDKGGDDRDRKIPGKLKNPFDGQDKVMIEREKFLEN